MSIYECESIDLTQPATTGYSSETSSGFSGSEDSPSRSRATQMTANTDTTAQSFGGRLAAVKSALRRKDQEIETLKTQVADLQRQLSSGNDEKPVAERDVVLYNSAGPLAAATASPTMQEDGADRSSTCWRCLSVPAVTLLAATSAVWWYYVW